MSVRSEEGVREISSPPARSPRAIASSIGQSRTLIGKVNDEAHAGRRELEEELVLSHEQVACVIRTKPSGHIV